MTGLDDEGWMVRHCTGTEESKGIGKQSKDK